MRCWENVVFLVSIILLVQGQTVVAKKTFNDLPALYNFDKYDECLYDKAPSKLATTYCMVYAEIKPDNSSEIWQKIKAHSEVNSFNYRRDRLFIGLCMKRCVDYVKSLAFDPKTKYTEDDIVNNVISKHFANVHKRPFDLEMRQNYSAMIHTCLNDEFEKTYNLKLRTFVKYCETLEDIELHAHLASTDRSMSYLWRFVIGMALLTAMSTYYDYRLKNKEEPEKQTNAFYQIPLVDSVPRILTSFSLCRNYYRLLQPYNTPMGIELAYLDGYRSLTSIGVTFFHIIYVHSSHLQNPEFMEFFGNTKIGTLMLNVPIAIEIFLVMSGFFLFLKFQQSQCITPETSIWKCIELVLRYGVQRLLRYLPSLGLLVLFNAAAISRLGDGPFWRHFMDVNRSFARETWWKNLLMINNFYHTTTVGPHTYSIALDFQLYIFYASVLVAMAKYPQYKYRIIKIIACLAVAIPTLISYFFKLGSLYIPNAESYRIGITYDSGELVHQYIPFYTNLGGYLVGICFGDFYLNYNDLRKKVEELVQRFSYTTVTLLTLWGLGILWVGSIMVFEEPSWKTAVFSGLHRNLWALFVCGFPMLMGMLQIFSFLIDLAAEIVRNPAFRCLSRLSFQLFLWHFPVFKVNLAHMRQPVHMNLIYYVSLFLTTIITSAIIAFFLTILVEYPFSQLLDRLQIVPARKRTNVTEEAKGPKIQ